MFRLHSRLIIRLFEVMPEHAVEQVHVEAWELGDGMVERVLQDVRIDVVRQLGRIAEHGLRGAACLGGVELADVV